jgi:two-component system phosphate regulon response regulator PhoB
MPLILVADSKGIVVGPTRIVLIEEGPLIERLISLFERPDDAVDDAQVVARRADPPGQRNGKCVCEAHILAPNLILLDLTRACPDQTEAWRQLRDGKVAYDPAVLKLALKKPEPGNRSEDGPTLHVEQEHRAPELTNDEPQSSGEPLTDLSPALHEPVLQMGPVRIDRHGHWAYFEEKKLHLTPTEFRLLECFLREPGRAFTRSQLLDVSIGNASFVLQRTIDVHIRSLRTKLGSARELIETVRGVGYRFRENQESH